MKRRILFAFKAAVTVGLLVWLLGRAELGRIGEALGGATPAWIAGAFALHGVGLFVSAVRWRMLLAAQGTEAPLGFLTRSLLTGIFFNNFLPSTVGGDLMRARDTAEYAGSGTRAMTVVLVERASGIFALGFFALAAPLSGGLTADGTGLKAAWIGVGALLFGFVGFMILLRPGTLAALRAALERRCAAGDAEARTGARLVGKAEHLLGTLEAIARAPGLLRGIFLLALLLQANVILHFWCIARALGLRLPLSALLFIVPVATLLLLLPISINGIGAREAVFAFFLTRQGATLAEAVAFSGVAYGLVLAQGLIGGLLYALRPHASRRSAPP